MHHVFARGNDKQLIFRDSRDCWLYLGLLDRVVVQNSWRCLSYCLMANHVHRLLETPRPNLGGTLPIRDGAITVPDGPGLGV